jgi:hypothetical protein
MGSFISSCPSAYTTGDSCSTNIFGGKGDIETICSATNYSDSVTLSGNITVNKRFDDSLNVTAVPCILGFMCYRQYAETLGSFCDLAAHQTNGTTCGSSGTYYLNASTYDIPEEIKTYTGGYLGAIEIKLYLGLSEDCEAQRTTSSFATWLGFSVVPVAGLATIFVRRQRRRPLLHLEEASDSFVEMGSMPHRAAMV